MKRRLFNSSGDDERAGAIREYREAMQGAQGTLKRLGYDFSRGSLPAANAPKWAFGNMSTEAIRREASELRAFRQEGITEELDRTVTSAGRAGYTGADTHDAISALMEATDEQYRDALRDLIESQYDAIDVAAELVKGDDSEAYQDWLDAIGDELVTEDDLADIFGDDYEAIF